MKIVFVMAVSLLALSCAHSGQVESPNSPRESDRMLSVHIHDASLRAGDELVAKRYLCKEKRVSERNTGLTSCTSQPIGCAKVIRASGKEAYLVELDPETRFDAELLFERPAVGSICLR